MKIKNKVFAIECKSSLSPSLTKGNYFALEDITPDYVFVIAPLEEGWKVNNTIEVTSIRAAFSRIKELVKL